MTFYDFHVDDVPDDPAAMLRMAQDQLAEIAARGAGLCGRCQLTLDGSCGGAYGVSRCDHFEPIRTTPGPVNGDTGEQTPMDGQVPPRLPAKALASASPNRGRAAFFHPCPSPEGCAGAATVAAPAAADAATGLDKSGYGSRELHGGPVYTGGRR